MGKPNAWLAAQKAKMEEEFLVGAMDLKANAIYHDKPEFFRAKE